MEVQEVTIGVVSEAAAKSVGYFFSTHRASGLRGLGTDVLQWTLPHAALGRVYTCLPLEHVWKKAVQFIDGTVRSPATPSAVGASLDICVVNFWLIRIHNRGPICPWHVPPSNMKRLDRVDHRLHCNGREHKTTGRQCLATNLQHIFQNSL